jgi:hypothetical protein
LNPGPRRRSCQILSLDRYNKFRPDYRMAGEFVEAETHRE